MTSSEARTQNKLKFDHQQQRCTTRCSKRPTTRQHHNSTWHSARSFTQTCRKHQPSHMGEQNHALVCSPPTPSAHHSPRNVQCVPGHPMHADLPVTCALVRGKHTAQCTAVHPPLWGRQKESGAGGVPRPSTPSCAQCWPLRHGCLMHCHYVFAVKRNQENQAHHACWRIYARSRPS